MTGEQRRAQILARLREDGKPVPAKDLAAEFQVSRQVIVQDIALIRAVGCEVISTNRGYLLQEEESISRVFKVCHTDEELEEELRLIVDLGGCVENVIVQHSVYGRLEAPLKVGSGRRIREFLGEIQSGKSSPLKNVTSGYHYHRVSADSGKTLDLIENALRERGFLVEDE